jgi:hypothetical protein
VNLWSPLHRVFAVGDRERATPTLTGLGREPNFPLGIRRTTGLLCASDRASIIALPSEAFHLAGELRTWPVQALGLFRFWKIVWRKADDLLDLDPRGEDFVLLYRGSVFERSGPNAALRDLARGRTMVALLTVGPERKRAVVRTLYESDLRWTTFPICDNLEADVP